MAKRSKQILWLALPPYIYSFTNQFICTFLSMHVTESICYIVFIQILLKPLFKLIEVHIYESYH